MGFQPEEYLNKNRKAIIKRESNNGRGELQDFVTKSFDTFGSLDTFKCTIRILHLSQEISIQSHKGSL